jgi:hypothetical protein
MGRMTAAHKQASHLNVGWKDRKVRSGGTAMVGCVTVPAGTRI